MKNILLFLITIYSITAQAQVSEQWRKFYDGPGNNVDQAYAITVDADGNVYVTGSSQSGSTFSDDYLTIKYDSSGNEIWTARYDGLGAGIDIAHDIAVDAIGNVYVTGEGWEGNSTEYYDYVTIKYDSTGDSLWVARYNGPKNGGDKAYSIALDDSGNVYVTGESEGLSGAHGIYEDYATVKYSSNGVQVWVARYDAPNSDYDKAISVKVDTLKNVYVTGTSDGGSAISTDSHFDYLTVKYDSMGIQQWAQRFNGYGDNNNDDARAMRIDDSGNVYVTGKARNDTTGNDVGTIKYNTAGTLLWSQFYALPGSYTDEGNDIAVSATGSVYVTGDAFDTLVYNKQILVLKYKFDGTPLWSQIINGVGNGDDAGNSIALGNNAVYVTGFTFYNSTRQQDYTTFDFDTTGAEQWRMYMDQVIGINSVTNEVPAEIYADALERVYVTGYSGFDYGTVKYSDAPNGINDLNRKSALAIYPNPAAEELFINSAVEILSLKIYSVLGEEIISQEKASIKKSGIDISQIPDGIYFISAFAGRNILTAKFMIQR